MIEGRRLLILSASAALHLAAIGLGLLVAGAGAGSAILVDLMADGASENVRDTPARLVAPPPPAGSGRAERASVPLAPPALALDRSPAPSRPPEKSALA